MEILLQWLDDIDDLAATARMVAPSILPGLSFVLGLGALLVACLWLQIPAVALVLLVVISAVGVSLIATHLRRRSRSSTL